MNNVIGSLITLRDKHGFGYKKQLQILDIGCCYGHWARSVSTVFPDSHFLLIDGIDYKPSKNVSSPSDFIKAVLAEREKDVVWYEMRNTGDSIFRENTTFFKDCEKIIKRAVTLDSLFTEGKIFDIIKIDTQGSELPILIGGYKTIKGCPIIILEIPFMGQYNTGVPNFYKHMQYMEWIHYVPYDIVEYHYYHGFLVQIDIIFIADTHYIIEETQRIIQDAPC